MDKGLRIDQGPQRVVEPLRRRIKLVLFLNGGWVEYVLSLHHPGFHFLGEFGSD